ncbi:MAG TPA: hypothetical protein VKB79_12060 [Bryobacteraceae bacterium]|nr:hypothetical protein [Bryobacteraceae bacterium]
MIEDLIRRARRRIVLNGALGQVAFAGVFALSGLALVLLFGTRYLNFWPLAAFTVLGIVIGGARAWRSAPDPYSTAVQLDHDAGLSDALSTAWYFGAHATECSEVRRMQRELAEQAARAIDLETAVPFTFPRALYLFAALALLASVIVGVRFRSGGRLDLRPPLTEILFEDLAAPQAKKQVRSDHSDRKRLDTAESLLAKLGMRVNADDPKNDAESLDKAIDQALDGVPAGNEKGEKSQGQAKSQDGKAGSGVEKQPDGDPLDGKPSENGGESADNANPSNQQNPSGDKGNSKSASGDNASILSKLKDAVSNMFSKSKPASGSEKGQQQGQMAKSEKGNSDKNASGKGKEQGESQADAQDGEPSNDAQDGQQAQGKAGSKSSQQSAQAGSGVGSQDGAKDLKAAEQLKAMGKISEIIGKRASTVTGETTIEVQSGNQQLRTAYSKTAANHGETDSDLSRDEIPVTLQPYIQQYFEQIRKSAPAGKPR